MVNAQTVILVINNGVNTREELHKVSSSYDIGFVAGYIQSLKDRGIRVSIKLH